MKLKQSQIKTYREAQLDVQGQCCALCGEVIQGDAVLDHDHKTGRIRRVLHRGCNAILGKIENNLARNKITPSRLKSIAHNLVGYINTAHTDLVHPTYKSQEERKQIRKNKAKKRIKPILQA